MKQGIIKTMLILCTVSCLLAACTKEVETVLPEGFYYTPAPEPGTILLYEEESQYGEYGKDYYFKSEWVIDNQVVDQTILIFNWMDRKRNGISIDHMPNNVLLSWLFTASGDASPLIKDSNGLSLHLEYSGKSESYRYYYFDIRNAYDYNIYINNELYWVYPIFSENPTASYNPVNEKFILSMKLTGITLKKVSTKEETSYQYNSLLTLTLVTLVIWQRKEDFILNMHL